MKNSKIIYISLYITKKYIMKVYIPSMVYIFYNDKKDHERTKENWQKITTTHAKESRRFFSKYSRHEMTQEREINDKKYSTPDQNLLMSVSNQVIVIDQWKFDRYGHLITNHLHSLINHSSSSSSFSSIIILIICIVFAILSQTYWLALFLSSRQREPTSPQSDNHQM